MARYEKVEALAQAPYQLGYTFLRLPRAKQPKPSSKNVAGSGISVPLMVYVIS
jgi:hypothetical protein